MAKENETIADIIAEMRSDANADEYTPDGILGQTLNCLADRLEAAHRREVQDALDAGGFVEASRKNKHVGDYAKLREAMLSIRADILKRRSENCWYATDSDILEKIDAALAAPPRNCDVARDWVRDLYAHFQPPASIKREMPPEWVDSVMAFCRWLVAPATEKEGGAK